MRIDDEPGGGLRLTPARQSAAIVIAVAGAILLCLSRLPEDRTLAFAASTTLVGLVILVGAAVAGTAAHTASLVRRVRGRAFVGTQPDDEGSGHYREAPRRPLVLVDGEPLEGPVRVEARRERPERGPAAYKVYLVGARQLLIVGDEPTASGRARWCGGSRARSGSRPRRRTSSASSASRPIRRGRCGSRSSLRSCIWRWRSRCRTGCSRGRSWWRSASRSRRWCWCRSARSATARGRRLARRRRGRGWQRSSRCAAERVPARRRTVRR